MNNLIENTTFRNYPHNLGILSELKETIEREFLKEKTPYNEFVKNLYSDRINEEWFLSQCQSICNQIEKLLSEDSWFNKFPCAFLTDNDKIILSQELLFDISYLEQLTKYKYKINKEGEMNSRSDFLSSDQFFLHAKFSYFTRKDMIPATTQRNFAVSSMPILIRQAIEIKVKNMIGLEKVTKKNGDFTSISISRILDFFIENPSYFDMPVSFETLKAINEWTNSFVHTGIIPFCWQSLEAIDLIEKLFSTADKESGAWHLNGFSYLSKETSLTELKNSLDKKLNANFTLNKDKIEGGLLHPLKS